MGKTPLNWAEIKAYSDLSGIELSGWEARNVIMMSRGYCSMNYIATEERPAKPPWEPELTEHDIYLRGVFASGRADEALKIESY